MKTDTALEAEGGMPVSAGLPGFISRHVLASKLADIDPATYFTCRLIYINDGTCLVVISGRVVAECRSTAEALGVLALACEMLRERQ